jgi:pimeloyl-ACP methyl ester carboxylesterase
MLGHDLLGAGPHRVLLLNDWLGDTSTWDGARPYLDTARFTWAFADLRGYGRSRRQKGEFSLAEATADVSALADALGWTRFSIVGHSMSTLVALRVAQEYPDRVGRVILLTPPPPAGFGADAATVEAIAGLALGDDAHRMNYLRMRMGEQMSEGWLRFKAARWRETADPGAVAAYVPMFASRGLPEPARRIAAPLLAITGEQDAEIMRSAAARAFLAPLSDQLTVTPLADCGHYPMQECPPLLVTLVERFLIADATPAA